MLPFSRLLTLGFYLHGNNHPVMQLSSFFVEHLFACLSSWCSHATAPMTQGLVLALRVAKLLWRSARFVVSLDTIVMGLAG